MRVQWTADRIERLRKLHGAGLSASQIAAELGGITRNSVIGKAHRLGLDGRPKNPSSTAPRQRKRRPVVDRMVSVERRPSRVATAPAHLAKPEAERSPLGYDNVVPLHQRATLFELSEANCHWPVGDPGSADFFFCGGKAHGGLPYCAHHSRVAYRAVADRRGR